MDSIANNINSLNKENLFSLVPYSLKTDIEKFKDQMAVRELMYKAKAEGNYTLLELLFGFGNKLNQLKDLQENYSQAYLDYSSPVPENYIVSHARASYKKVAPKRTVIVFLTFISTIIILSGWIVFYEKFSSVFRQTK